METARKREELVKVLADAFDASESIKAERKSASKKYHQVLWLIWQLVKVQGERKDKAVDTYTSPNFVH